jgi:predicted acylesterase/phospholipase RssA
MRRAQCQIFIFMIFTLLAAGYVVGASAAVNAGIDTGINTNIGNDVNTIVDTIVNTNISTNVNRIVNADTGINVNTVINTDADTGVDTNINTNVNSTPVNPKKQKFALILSGGGSRGLAQIGVLTALDEAGLKPDIIVSTSMGSVVGGLYACGHTPAQIQAIARSVDWSRVSANTYSRTSLFVSQKSPPKGYLFDIRLGSNFRPALPNAISDGQIFYELLTAKTLPALHAAGYDFDKLPVSLRVVATDLLTGNKVIFSEGSLSAAIRASCSAPLAFSPLELDGKMLIDGGLSSNIPVQAAVDAGADFTVAIDVTSPLWGRDQLIDNPVRLMEQVVSIGVAQNKLRDTRGADVLITPKLGGITNTDFSRIDSLISLGYAATAEAIPEIAARLGKRAAKISADGALNRSTSTQSADSGRTNPEPTQPPGGSAILPSVKSVRIFGNKLTSANQTLTASGIKIGKPLDSAAVERAIRSLYATELFESVRVETAPDDGVEIRVDEKKYWRVRGGLRYDEYQLGEGFIEPAYENLFGLGISAALHMQYGARKEKYAIGLATNFLFTQNWALSYNAQIFTGRERIYNRDVYVREPTAPDQTPLPDSIVISDEVLGKGGIALVVGSQIGKSVSVEAGAKFERFQLLQSNQSIFDKDLGFGFRNSLPYFLLRLNIDTRDAAPFTKNGWRHIVTTGMAGDIWGLSGIEEFVKIDGNFNRYVTLSKRHTLHGQIVFGWTNDTLPDVEKFYLGGAIPEQNYRDADIYNIVPFMGMKPRMVSADVFGLAHLEYRLKIRRNIYLSAALDWARLWAYEEFVRRQDADYDFSPKSPLGAGVGVAYNTIFGPIRLSYGRLIQYKYDPAAVPEHVFYFSAGYDF